MVTEFFKVAAEIVPFVGQWIDAGNGVTERAIGENQSVHACLQKGFAFFARRRSYSRAISLRQIAELKALKESRPTRLD